ncbi:MAG: ABC transporter substrate-binding protein [Bacteroidota bacterium]
MKRILCILCIFSFFSCNLLKQAGTVSLDSSAETLIASGKRLLRSKNYTDAMDKFELAWDRDFHRSSTAALFLSGLSAYYAGFDKVAQERFDTLIRKYPKSRYVDDANYHMALMLADKSDASLRIKGLNEMVRLGEQSRIEQIRTQSTQQIEHILFEEIPLDELESQFGSVSGQLASHWMEALAYRLIRADRREDAVQHYEEFQTKSRAESPFLDKLFPADAPITEAPRRIEPEMFRIALVLPLYYNGFMNYYDKVPAESQRAIEFYEGFQLAVEELGPGLSKEVYLKTFDTQRDTALTQGILSKLDYLQPDVIVGGIYNTQSRIISDWSEEKRIPQIIPLSPTAELVHEKKFTFLAHPSVKTHGARMAEYAWNELSLSHISVFTDQSPGTQPLAEGFMETFVSLGGTVDTMMFHPNYDIAIEQIPDLVDSIPDYETGVGVYIPLMNNEESAGLIVNLVKQRSKDVMMMGSPHFRSRYNTLSRDTKEGFELLFTTSHLHNPESSGYRSLYNQYLKKYAYPPSDNVIQGYDLGKYLMELVKLYNPAPFTLDTYLRNNPNFEGIHLDYRFDYQQSNQHVNIGQYTEEGLIKVK